MCNSPITILCRIRYSTTTPLRRLKKNECYKRRGREIIIHYLPLLGTYMLIFIFLQPQLYMSTITINSLYFHEKKFVFKAVCSRLCLMRFFQNSPFTIIIKKLLYSVFYFILLSHVKEIGQDLHVKAHKTYVCVFYVLLNVPRL